MNGPELLEEFKRHLIVDRGRQSNTVKIYDTDLRQFITFITGNKPEEFDPTTISTADVRSWFASLAQKKISPTSIRRKLQSLRAFFFFAVKRGVIKSDPTFPIYMTVHKRRLPYFVPEKEMEQILNSDRFDMESFEGTRDMLIVTLLYTLGLRRAEAISLKEDNFDLARKELTVVGKGNKTRVLPLPDTIIQLFTNYLRLRDKEYPLYINGMRLLAHKGLPMQPWMLANIVRNVLSDSNVPKKSPHVLRHSFATAMLNHGADIETVREFLGHSSLATTQIYTHVTWAEMQKEYMAAHPRAGLEPYPEENESKLAFESPEKGAEEANKE